MNFPDILMAILGGTLIGLASSGLLFSVGRVAGISGILGGLLKPSAGDVAWRVAFIAGLLAGGLMMGWAIPAVFHAPSGRSFGAIVLAGLMVGFGVRMGNGCTSGHGVCGLSRRSRRSLVATLMFMATGALTATAIHIFGGGIL
jgi:uncharacterized membrane protein YedE/YeeE